MYDELGSTLIHWHGFGAEGESIVFTKGITSVGGRTICIGEFIIKESMTLGVSWILLDIGYFLLFKLFCFIL